MRDDIRRLQQIVYNYMKTNKLTQEKMAERGAPELSRGKLCYLLNGNANSMDVNMLVGYAKALHMPLSTLCAQMHVQTAVPQSTRMGELLAELQVVADLVPIGQREGMELELKDVIERAKTTIPMSKF